MREEKKEKFSYVTAIIISLICFIFIVIHWNYQNRVDRVTLILLAMGLSPWLTKFFTKIKLGNIEAHSASERSQGSTTKPLPPLELQITRPLTSLEHKITKPSLDLSNDAKKILATLWKYQKQIFKEDNVKRWTFRLFPNATQYPLYLSGLAELLKLGLVSMDFQNEHCMLTNEGMNFMENNKDLQDYSDSYKF